MPVIVKSNDDLRQEQFVSQLLRQFQSIFAEAMVPVWVRPYGMCIRRRRARNAIHETELACNCPIAHSIPYTTTHCCSAVLLPCVPVLG